MTRSKRQFNKGFTLIEVLVSVFIVGLAIAALMIANRSSTTANGEGIDLSTAEFLTEQIRELTAMLRDDQVDNLYNLSGPHCPPIDANNQPITALAAFTQEITIKNVSASNFNQTVADHSTSFYKVTVKIFRNSDLISQTSWIRTKI